MRINNENILALMGSDFHDRAMEYYNTVLAYPDLLERFEARATLIRFKYDGEEYRDAMTKLDTNRRRKHDAAMAALNTMNRMCEKSGLEPVTEPADFSEINRTEVGDAICDHVKEVLDRDRQKENKKQHSHTHSSPEVEFERDVEVATDEPEL